MHAIHIDFRFNKFTTIHLKATAEAEEEAETEAEEALTAFVAAVSQSVVPVASSLSTLLRMLLYSFTAMSLDFWFF